MTIAPSQPQDWTSGPAKWAAVIVLGASSIAGMAWSIFFREPAPIRATRSEPQPVALTASPAHNTPSAPAPTPPSTTAPQPPAAPLATPTQPIQPPPPVPQPEAQPAAASPALTTPPATTEPPATDAAPTPPRPARINLNTATAAELELLPGIGPVVAARIIEHRTKNGRFKSISALDAVKGIGPKTIDSLRPLVTVD